jgi:hypothetical protein
MKKSQAYYIDICACNNLLAHVGIMAKSILQDNFHFNIFELLKIQTKMLMLLQILLEYIYL